jgi:tetratricopeptide (TPR) repeat protein
MNQTINEEEAIKQYLLGRLPEDEKTRLEERLLTDDDFFERLNLAEDELIDEYLAGELDAENRQRFDKHFLAAPERQRKVRFSMALRKYVSAGPAPNVGPVGASVYGTGSIRTIQDLVAGPGSYPGAPRKLEKPGVGREVDASEYRVVPGPWRRAASNPYVRMAASLVLVAGVALLVYRAFFYQSEVDKGLAVLKSAYPADRPIQARLTTWGYGAFRETRGGSPVNESHVNHDRAEVILQDEFARDPNPQSRHALGLLLLTDRRFEEAINHLRTATESEPKNAQYRSDLAAGLLEKSKNDKFIAEREGGQEAAVKIDEELNECGEQIERALALDPSLVAALFNRGLLDLALDHPQQAEQHWKEYLLRDSTSPWADEARRNLEWIRGQRTGG